MWFDGADCATPPLAAKKCKLHVAFRDLGTDIEQFAQRERGASSGLVEQPVALGEGPQPFLDPLELFA